MAESVSVAYRTVKYNKRFYANKCTGPELTRPQYRAD